MSTVKDLEEELKEVNLLLKDATAEISKWRTIQRDLETKKENIKKKINKLNSDEISNLDWTGTDYPWSEEVKNVLETRFCIKTFRAQQLSAINATLSNCNAIVVMPTGAGKSLCYQLPALVKPGITIVISPLVSLMEDQVRSLTVKGIPAKAITSTSPKEETNAALNDLKDKSSKVKLVYVTPERLSKSKRFMANLQKCHAEGRLQRIAIDEVHCCSQWGHDFRPDYKFLGILSNMFKGVPILGLTATATAHVLQDVQKILNIPGCLFIKSPFNRPNLFYKIMAKPTSQEECISILVKLLKYRYKGKSGIIYTNTIKECETVGDGLRKQGLKVGCYHANLEAKSRTSIHTKWHENCYQAIVATVAFGMGIDKPDVRFVIHYTISKSMENYYQESGRAGRDSRRAECITLYRMQDIFKISTMVFSSVGNLDHLYGMVKYCLTSTECRRRIISKHFDEDWGDGDCDKMCDVCSNENNNTKEITITAHCKLLADLIDSAAKQDVKLTAQKLIDAWYMKGPVNLRHGGSEPHFPRAVGEDVIAYLLVNGYLIEDFHFTAYATISYILKGPNMESAYSSQFNLVMPVRKYTHFDLEKQAPEDYVPKGVEVKLNKRKKKESIESMKESKKIKIIELD